MKKRLDKLTATVKSSNIKEKQKGNKTKSPGDSPQKDESESRPRDLGHLQLGPLNHIKDPSNVISVRVGAMAGGNVQRRETWIGGGSGGAHPHRKSKPRNCSTVEEEVSSAGSVSQS